ncbi:MAG: MarR family transcriptional regulator [bacterium]|nr:MarR family transcriptional regulator [bacterium]
MAAKGSLSTQTLDSLLKNLLVLARTVERALGQEAVKAAVSEHLSPSKVQILRLLGVRTSQTSSQIARFLAVSKPAVTQLVDSMVRRRMVVRKTAKHDRREVDLRLTEKGRRAYLAIRREQQHMLRSAAKRGPSTGGTTQWNKTLSEVTESLAHACGAFEEYCLQCGAHDEDSCVLSGGKSDCLFAQGEKGRGADAKKSATRGTAKRTKTKTKAKATTKKKVRRR